MEQFRKSSICFTIYVEFQIPLKEIAFQVGDTHKTVQKLFEGIKVIEQAERENVFDREDVRRGRLYFSHLYTGLQYDGFRDFLNISEQSLESENPVPSENVQELEEFLLWLYGSKKADIEPLVRTQNPDLKKLENIVKSDEALSAIRAHHPLDFAYELSQPKNKIFEDNIFAAQRNVQKAWSYVNEGYDGSEKILDVCMKLADRVDDLFEKMKSIRTEKYSNSKKKRRRQDDAL